MKNIDGLKITILVPMYNEANRILRTLVDIKDFMSLNKGLIEEIVLVDDGSKDKTVETVLSMSGVLPIKVVRQFPNAGKWAAVKLGIENVTKTDCVLLLDADGSANINELYHIDLDLVKRNKQNVFGSRFLQGSTVEGKSFIRNIVSRGYRIYVRALYRWVTGMNDVDDTQCPFKIFFKSNLKNELSGGRWCGDFELCLSLKGGIANVPVDFIHMTGSKIKKSTAWSMFIDTWKIARRFKNLKKVNK